MPPPSPYIVYGTAKKDDAVLASTTITITNVTAGGSDTRTTDASGNYIYDDLATLPNGYAPGDTIKVSSPEFLITFAAASAPEEKQIDLNYYGRRRLAYINGVVQNCPGT